MKKKYASEIVISVKKRRAEAQGFFFLKAQQTFDTWFLHFSIHFCDLKLRAVLAVTKVSLTSVSLPLLIQQGR